MTLQGLTGVGWGGLCLPWIRVCIRIVPLCVSVEFLCLSVYQSVCLSKSLYMYMPVCLHVSLSPLSLPLSLSPPLSLSLGICRVNLADQGSRARYRVIQFYSWDSKSVPLLVDNHYPNYASFIRKVPLHARIQKVLSEGVQP